MRCKCVVYVDVFPRGGDVTTLTSHWEAPLCVLTRFWPLLAIFGNCRLTPLTADEYRCTGIRQYAKKRQA